MRKALTTLTFALVLASGVAGCDSKIDQCNAFITEANTAQNTFTAISAAMNDPAQLKAKAAEIDESVRKLKAVELKDEKLVGFRDRYASGLESIGKNLTKMAELDKTKDVEELTKLAESFAKDGDDMSKLIDEVNGYCGGTE